jgi:hypothetical protein
MIFDEDDAGSGFWGAGDDRSGLNHGGHGSTVSPYIAAFP